ncbi:MAG TPA: glycosyltransferase family 1 protein [Solirubrobacteraceae bacterium]|nr:glycosyltransferase family 1 protein [Solirubrobacteraceae bacterium]
MKVGLNLVYLVEDSGGSGTYARHLTASLLEVEPGLELTAWIGSSAPESLLREPWAERVRWVRLPVVGIGSPWHLWHELAAIGFDARRRGIEVVHGLANINPVVHPGVATVTTILDVIWAHHPEAASTRFRMMGKLVTPVVGRASTRLVAISEAARDDVAATLGLDREKFDVTPLGIDPPPPRASAPDRAAVAARLGLSEQPVVLCLAAKRAHKNLHGLIRAWALLAERPGQLVLPGSPNAYEQDLRELAGTLGVQDSVRFLGWLSAEDVEDLYAIAACFVLPTFLEGFGLPVLEAMARGVPVACSDIGALREVAGDAALFFDPHAPESIAAAIERLMSDAPLRAELVERGRARCALFTWQRTARATLESYRRALGS